jgi:phosphate:Na+ symporter
MKVFLKILAFVFVLFQTNLNANQEPVSSDSLPQSVSSVQKPEGPKTNIDTLKYDHEAFLFLNQKSGEHEVELQWSIHPAYRDKIQYVVVKYTTKLKSEIKGHEWEVSEPILAESGSLKLENLQDNNSYVWKLGYSKIGNLKENLLNKDAMVWSEKSGFKTDLSWGFMKILIMIGSLGLFIYGMKVMSDGLQQAAGNRLRGMLGSITSNRVKGVLTGFGITSLVQSSSVTTVMTVSFVNAGLLTLTQSAGIMMGANIGTTITGWLINLFGFKISLASYSFMFIAFGAPLLFFGKTKLKSWSNVIIGFALLFMGLGALKTSVPSLDENSALVQFFVDYQGIPVISTLLFVGLGAIVTVVIQSSSAAMALTMTMVAADIIPFEVACAMILGENIGTTITAELASTIGNVHAKRSARIHSLFNLIGVTWMVIVYPLFISGLIYVQSDVLDWGNPETEVTARNTGLAIFHTAFNLMNVLLLIWFVPNIVRIAERTVKSKGGSDEEFRLDYIGNSSLVPPELAILEAKKEVAKFGKLTGRMSTFTSKLLFVQDKKKKEKLYSKIKKYEEITDRVEIEVADFLGKMASSEMSDTASARSSAMNSITNDLERIGDIFYQMSKQIERKEEMKMWFTPEQRNNLNEMLGLIDEAFEVMNNNLSIDYAQVTMDEASKVEEKINGMRNKLRKSHYKNMESDTYNKKSGMIYNDLFSSLEKVGDHIINVTEAIVETH